MKYVLLFVILTGSCTEKNQGQLYLDGPAPPGAQSPSPVPGWDPSKPPPTVMLMMYVVHNQTALMARQNVILAHLSEDLAARTGEDPDEVMETLMQQIDEEHARLWALTRRDLGLDRQPAR